MVNLNSVHKPKKFDKSKFKKKKLTIELIPTTCYKKNVRSEYSKEVWDIIRKRAYLKAGYRCEICGGRGKKWAVECHEVFSYNQKTKVQKLEKLEAICPLCHKVKHIGRTKHQRVDYKKAIKHFCKVNNITYEKAIEQVKIALNIHRKRALHEWKLDLTLIKENYDI